MKKLMLLPMVLLLAACGDFEGKNTTEKENVTRLYYHVDTETGCEYVFDPRTGIYPRIDKDGVTHKGCGDVAK